MKKINKKVLTLVLAIGLALSSPLAVLAAPTHFVVNNKGYIVSELTPSNPNYLNELLAEIASGAPTYIADDEGKTFNINEITGDYMEAFAKAPNIAASLGPVREVEGDLTAGEIISLPGVQAETELKIETVIKISGGRVHVRFKELAEDLVDANVLVKDPYGEVYSTIPKTLEAGTTETYFSFKDPMGEPSPMNAPWTVNGVAYEIAPDQVIPYYYYGRTDAFRHLSITLRDSIYYLPRIVKLADYELFLVGEPVSADEMYEWLVNSNETNVQVLLTDTTLDMRSPAGKKFVENEREAAEVLRLINIERVENGLTEFELDKKLHEVARLKSQDMVENNYFSHTSPTYGSPFEMLDSFDVDYFRAGENIAKGHGNAQQVVNGWMNSPGHRKNILNPDFNKIGIGVYSNESNVIHWTQLFTN